jgi:4-amino-4-deoxy-L-arabinose transferase-like glycosyltransferase
MASLIKRLVFKGALLIILLFGLLLRLWGINYGLPYTFAPDEPTYLEITLRILHTGDLNPHWWFYPSMIFYLNAVALFLYFLLGRLTGAFTTLDDLALPEIVGIGVGKLALPEEFIVTRGLTALFGAGIIVIVYAIARRLYPDKWSALVAAAFSAVSYTMIRQSHRMGPDIFALFFLLASFYFSLRVLDTPRLRNYLLAGVFAGFAIACKYNAGLILIPFILAHFFNFGWAGWRRPGIYFAFAAAAFGFFVGTPYSILDFPDFWAGVQWQAFSYTIEGHAGEEGDALRWYLFYLWDTEEWIAWVGLLGAGWLLITRAKKNLMLVSFPLAYFAFVSTLFSRNDRTIMLLVPFLQVAAAVSIVAIGEWLVRAWRIKPSIVGAATTLVVALMLFSPARSAWAYVTDLLKTDSRETGRIWIDQNLPTGSRIFVEPYSPYVDPQRFRIESGSILEHPLNWYIRNGFEYLVLTYGNYGRFFENRARYGAIVSRYEEFFASFPEVIHLDDGGYEVRIFKTGVADLPANRVGVRLGIYASWLELVGYDLPATHVNHSVNPSLCWRALIARREPLQLTVHLLDHNDRQVTQSSGALFGAETVSGQWPQGVVCIPWMLTAPAEPGIYRLQLDVDAAGQGRVPALSRQNEPVSDKLFVGPVKVAPAPVSADELRQARASNVRLGDAIGLVAYSVQRQSDSASVTLYWKGLGQASTEYTVFVHLLDTNGTVRAQLDSQPWRRRYPTSIWDIGEIVRDDYSFSLLDLPPGEYRIAIGMYEYPGLVRLSILDASGNDWGDHLVLDDAVQVTK